MVCLLGALNRPITAGAARLASPTPRFEVTASFARPGVLQLQVSGASHYGTHAFSFKNIPAACCEKDGK